MFCWCSMGALFISNMLLMYPCVYVQTFHRKKIYHNSLSFTHEIIADPTGLAAYLRLEMRQLEGTWV